jgi:hypothetical protein
LMAAKFIVGLNVALFRGIRKFIHVNGRVDWGRVRFLSLSVAPVVLIYYLPEIIGIWTA